MIYTPQTNSVPIPSWDTGLHRIAPNIYAYLQSKGTWFRSNAGLIVGKEYALVVDSLATPEMTRSFIKEIRAVTDKPVAFIINTHHHGDHTWGNHLFEDAAVICHSKCWEMTQHNYPTPEYLQSLTELCPELDPLGIQITPPDMTFDKELTLYLGSTEVRIIHFKPGHTPGDIIVYLPQEKVVFAGDLLFLYSTPVGIDASFRGWIDALDSISELEANIYVPGHGPPCGSEGLHECRDYLSFLRYEVRRRFDARLDVYEAARSINLGRFKEWANWERIIINIDRLYREYRQEKPASPTERQALLAMSKRLLEEDKSCFATKEHEQEGK